LNITLASPTEIWTGLTTSPNRARILLDLVRHNEVDEVFDRDVSGIDKANDYNVLGCNFARVLDDVGARGVIPPAAGIKEIDCYAVTAYLPNPPSVPINETFSHIVI